MSASLAGLLRSLDGSKRRTNAASALLLLGSAEGFLGMMREELQALRMDPAIADRLAVPLMLRLLTGEGPTQLPPPPTPSPIQSSGERA